MSFIGNSSSGVTIWVGDPDCQTAHDAVLTWLKAHCSSFRTFSPIPSEPDKILKGNLGEAIAFCVGYWNNFSNAQYTPFPANAFNPLNTIAKSDLDIIWLFFGDTDNNDHIVLQEVKTTSDKSLSLANKLIDDYDKLFDTEPFTLRKRLDSIKSQVEFTLRRPDLLSRVDYLAGNCPQNSPKTRLLPTVVHERQNSDPQAKMIAIRSTICSRGWSSSAVEAWAIGLSDLNSRLIRLAMGHN